MDHCSTPCCWASGWLLFPYTTLFRSYRIDIAQGNYVEQEAVDKLRFGMTKQQVQYVMGSPMLVESGYPNTWYYIYLFTHGHEESIQKNLIVHFDDNGNLTSIDGVFPMSDSFFEKI